MIDAVVPRFRDTGPGMRDTGEVDDKIDVGHQRPPINMRAEMARC